MPFSETISQLDAEASPVLLNQILRMKSRGGIAVLAIEQIVD
jgi:hypothetical protein